MSGDAPAGTTPPWNLTKLLTKYKTNYTVQNKTKNYKGSHVSHRPQKKGLSER